MDRVGMKLGQAFCDELIKNCLAPSVPNKSELLPTFSIEVVDHAHMLQQSLQEMGFLQPGILCHSHALFSSFNFWVTNHCICV